MKELAAKADERWRSVPSFLDSPARQQPVAAIGVTDSKPVDPGATVDSNGENSAVEDRGDTRQEASQSNKEARMDTRRKRERGDNPWRRAQQGAPSENWQPATWTPGVAQRR